MKKYILFGAIIGISLQAAWVVDGEKVSNEFLVGSTASTIRHGGDKTEYEAYTDGIGSIVVKRNFYYKDINSLILKYAKKANEANSDVATYVLNSNTTSQEEKRIARKMQKESADSLFQKSCPTGSSYNEATNLCWRAITDNSGVPIRVKPNEQLCADFGMRMVKLAETEYSVPNGIPAVGDTWNWVSDVYNNGKLVVYKATAKNFASTYAAYYQVCVK